MMKSLDDSSAVAGMESVAMGVHHRLVGQDEPQHLPLTKVEHGGGLFECFK